MRSYVLIFTIENEKVICLKAVHFRDWIRVGFYQDVEQDQCGLFGSGIFGWSKNGIQMLLFDQNHAVDRPWGTKTSTVTM